MVKVFGRTGCAAAYAVRDFLHRRSGRVACICMLLSYGLHLLPVLPIMGTTGVQLKKGKLLS
jgi:hypothetical protein